MVFLPKLLRRLREVAPEVNIKTVAMPPNLLEQAMEAGEVDLAVGYFPDLTKHRFYQQRLFRHAFVCIARADHPDIGETLSLEQFLRIPHAVVSPEGRSQEIFDRLLEREGLKRRVLLSIPHFMSIPFIVTSSDLIVTLPRAVGTSFAQLANIKLLDPPFENPTFDLKQHWHERFHQDAANRWIRGLFYELFSEQEPMRVGVPRTGTEPWEV